MNLKNTGKIAFLCLAVLLARPSVAYVYTVIIHNTTDSTIVYGYRGAIMIDGFPVVSGATGTIPPYSYVILESMDYDYNERFAWSGAWFTNGVAVLHRTGFHKNASRDFVREEYWGFDGFGNPVGFSSIDFPVPDPPVIDVPSGWPFGDVPTGGLTLPYVSSNLDGEYKFDTVVGGWVWHSNWTDPLYVPPYSELGDGWTFGIRPGGPVMASNPGMPEWYLVPSITPPGPILEGSTNDLAQFALNNEYWLKEIHKQDTTRNSILSDLRQYVGALDLDVTVDAPAVTVNVPDVNVTVGAPPVTVNVPDVNVSIEDIEFPDSMIVDTELALEQYVYDGLNPADSVYWPDDDDTSEMWHRPITGDTAIVSALNTGADGVAANWSLDGGALGEGGGWFEAWIGGMYRNLVVVVDKLKFGLTAFSDVGKSYTLVVPFRGSSITLDWSSYQSVMSAFRAFVVFVLWVYAVKDIRNSLAMIFGGH